MPRGDGTGPMGLGRGIGCRRGLGFRRRLRRFLNVETSEDLRYEKELLEIQLDNVKKRLKEK